MKKNLHLSFLLALVFGFAQVASAQYCTPAYTTACGTYTMVVNNFNTTGGSVNISNNNTGCANTNGYVYYSNMGHTTLPNSTVNFSVTVGPNYPVHVYIWVDYNQDGDFYDAGEQVAYNSYVAASATWSSSFTLPSTASIGTTRMRIRTLYYGSSGMHPCNTLPYGEAEDYNFTILPPYNNDAGIAAILNPTVPTCDLDSVEMLVALQNMGANVLQNCSIYYQVNTSTPVAMYYTGSVAAQGGLDTVSIGYESFNNGDDLTIWTELPNGVTDSLASNDEQSMTTATGLSGTYAIPGDYATLNDAADDLEAYGVCGHVVFNLANGTYNEQVVFNDILGTDENNTVTFKSASGQWGDVILTSSSAPTLSFNGGDWITFQDVRINSNSGNVIRIPGESDNITLDHCWLKGVHSTSNPTYSLVYQTSSSDDLTFVNSKFEKGSSWFYSNSGSTSDYKENITIEDNYMKDQAYGYGYIYYVDGLEMNRNQFRNDSAFASTYAYFPMGYMNYVNNFNITQNYVAATAGYGWYYGLYMINCIGRSNPRSQIANNCILTGNSSVPPGYYSLYMSNSGVADIVNNSFTKSTNTNTYSMYITNGGLIRLLNNSVTNYASSYAAYIYGGFTVTESDNNNFYSTGGSLMYFGTSVYSTLEAYQNATGYDLNSISVDPEWESIENCITCNPDLNDAGQVIATNTIDIEGNNRSVLNPDIGAVEFVDPATFTLGGDDTLCGSEVIIEAGPAQSLVWTINNQTSTQSSVTLTANNEPVEYDIEVSINTEYCGTGSDEATYLVVPDATLDSNIHLCADETIDLMPGGGSSAMYSWNTGETTSSITVTEAGTYSVNKMELGCETEATSVVTKSQAVEIADQDVCAGNLPASINATIANGISYAWSGGSNINSATNDFTDPGSYTVTATDSYGCASTDEFNLAVLDSPTAVIIESHSSNAYFFDGTSSLQVSQNTTYNWDFGYNNMTATTPTASVIYPWSDPNAPTTYTVTLTIDNGCDVDVQQMDVTPDPLGIDAIAKGSFGLYPNPANDNVNYILDEAATAQGTVQVMDLAGRVLASQIIASGQVNGEINLSELAAGSYLVKIDVDGNSSVNTLIKQ